MDELIREIQDTLQPYFENSSFRLSAASQTTYISSGDYMSGAQNINKNSILPVKVLKWFEDFWIYMEITFITVAQQKFSDRTKRESYIAALRQKSLEINGEFYNVNLSMSVFQGDDADNQKIQLFRAEWDNYDDNTDHPQPHWQFYPFSDGSEISLIRKGMQAEDFDQFIALGKEAISFDSFIEGIDISNIQEVDLKRFHFAMNARWAVNKGDIHRLNSGIALTQWLAGALGNIRKQLIYSKR